MVCVVRGRTLQFIAASAVAAAGVLVSCKGRAATHLVVDGEKFTTRTIQDRQQGMPLCVFLAPEKWHDTSEVTWNYAYISNPVWAQYSVANPDNDEAVFGFPAQRYVWVEPNYGLARPGQNSMGQIQAQPAPPLQAFTYFIRQARGGLTGFKFVGSKELPDLPAALQANAPNQKLTGLGAKITYEQNGHAVEEEFYTIPYLVRIPYDGPQGRNWQINWGLDYLHSFRAPAGTLEKRRAVFATVEKSFRRNPAWTQRCQAIMNYLTQQFNAQLKAGYDQIAAAGRLSKQISANSDAFLANVDRQLQASRNSSAGSDSGASEPRSSTDKFDDYVRGVETVDDPLYGTSQHSINEQYHWTDGYGNYRHSNDATYDPNQHENGDWQLMQQTQ